MNTLLDTILYRSGYTSINDENRRELAYALLSYNSDNINNSEICENFNITNNEVEEFMSLWLGAITYELCGNARQKYVENFQEFCNDDDQLSQFASFANCDMEFIIDDFICAFLHLDTETELKKIDIPYMNLIQLRDIISCRTLSDILSDYRFLQTIEAGWRL